MRSRNLPSAAGGMAGAALSHDCGAASEMTAIRHARGSARSARPTGATRPRGRPTSYCPELADAIFELLCDGFPMNVICRVPGMPDRGTVRRWERQNAEFRRMIQRAREFGADTLAAEVVEIADAATIAPGRAEPDSGPEMARCEQRAEARRILRHSPRRVFTVNKKRGFPPIIPKRAPGRPTLYSPQLGQRIAARLTAGVPLSTICAGEGVDRSSVYRWRAEHPEDFCD